MLFFSGKVNRSFTDRVTNLFIDSYLEDVLTDDEFHVIADTLKYLMRIDEKFQELARDAFSKLKKQ